MHDQPHRPTRRSVRLPDHDYSQAGAYFVTVCTHERACLFGTVAEDAVQASVVGKVVRACWEQIPEHHAQVEADAFIIMPNHLHGIIVIEGDPNSELSGPTTPGAACSAPTAVRRAETPVLGHIVRSFKSACSRTVNQQVGRTVTLWQRGYYEHVIRGQAALARIREYIADNPAKWALDHDNPANWRR